jgi:hypothetical protein
MPILAVSSDERVFARGIESAKTLIRMLDVPDPRVQLAAATVIHDCTERVKMMVEELARQEEALSERLDQMER